MSELPRIGIYCTSKVDENLDFALRSIALNTQWPEFRFLVGADPGLEGHDPRGVLEEYKRKYPWFDYVYYEERPAALLGLGSPNDLLENLYRRLLAAGCSRFFQVNDDISVSRYWLHYVESAMQERLGGCGVVIPHDGLMSVDDRANFSGFYYFSQEYVERYHPHGTAYRTDPVQCYWVDTEFVVRAAHHGRLFREPRCCVLHLHHTALPTTAGLPSVRRAVRSNSVTDAAVFCKRMREEGIDPWRYLPGLAAMTPAEARPMVEALRGIGARAEEAA